MPRAIVIDDDPDIRSLLTRLLQRRGWSVREADNGHSGTELIRAAEPEVVFTDIFMPGGTGLDVLRAVAPLLGRLRVVVMSGDSHHDGADQFALARRLGAAATILKPFDLPALDALMDRLRSD